MTDETQTPPEVTNDDLLGAEPATPIAPVEHEQTPLVPEDLSAVSKHEADVVAQTTPPAAAPTPTNVLAPEHHSLLDQIVAKADLVREDIGKEIKDLVKAIKSVV